MVPSRVSPIKREAKAKSKPRHSSRSPPESLPCSSSARCRDPAAPAIVGGLKTATERSRKTVWPGAARGGQRPASARRIFGGIFLFSLSAGGGRDLDSRRWCGGWGLDSRRRRVLIELDGQLGGVDTSSCGDAERQPWRAWLRTGTRSGVGSRCGAAQQTGIPLRRRGGMAGGRRR